MRILNIYYAYSTHITRIMRIMRNMRITRIMRIFYAYTRIMRIYAYMRICVPLYVPLSKNQGPRGPTGGAHRPQPLPYYKVIVLLPIKTQRAAHAGPPRGGRRTSTACGSFRRPLNYNAGMSKGGVT